MHENLRRALDIAADQNAIMTRGQARSAGLTDRVIDRWLADGLFIALSKGIYRVRGAPQTERMAVAAAAVGASGHASHATGARLLRLRAPLPIAPIHVTVDAASQHLRLARLPIESGPFAFFPIKVHRFGVHGETILTIDGIPCSDAARVLMDIAPMVSFEDLEDAFERARKLGLVSTDALARRFAQIGGRGRPGTPKIRELLAHARPNPLESKLEGKAWRMLRASRIPEPVRQLRVDLPSRRWHRLDFAWPDQLVAFETEGFEWHGSRARWKRDRVRTAALERLGWRIVVATWEDVVAEPDATLDRIGMALNERNAFAISA